MSLTVAQHILEVPYNVGVQNSYFYSKEYLEQGGFLTTGNSVYDTNLMNEYRPVYLTIMAMSQYHNQGANIRLHNPTDSIVIYKTIKQHLTNWQRVVNEVINAPLPPTEDLEILDKLAANLYPIACSYSAELKTTLNKDWNSKSRFFGRGNSIPKSETQQVQQTLDPGHSMISDAIARSTFMRRKSYLGE